MPIHILPPELASQIAAGEVIERPASVVKELVENSLDASSKAITIVTEDAGKRLIEVSDDGIGIPSEELILSVERHATSKINNADDLHHIYTLGFRGEALASIASVSHLTIISRSENENTGAQVKVIGGQIDSIQPFGSPVGTSVRVENLFYNVPARLKFMKRNRTEKQYIDRLVTRYAMAYPNVRFTLRQDGKLALQTSGNGNKREVLSNLYGVEIANQMLEVTYRNDTIRISGFISPPSVTRSNRREITFFVNGRPVKDSTLNAALTRAYHTLLMVGRFPIAVLFIEINPEYVDVNVHPTKAEVRFQKADAVFSSVQSAVRKALLAHSPIPELGEQITWQPDEQNTKNSYRRETTNWNWESSIPHPQSWQVPNDDSTIISNPETQPTNQAALPGEQPPLLRPIGQIATTYLVAEGPDGLYLIDQHAAHERVLFEKMLAQRETQIPSQQLLQPVTVEFPPDSARLLNEQIPILNELGFVVEHFGVNTFLVRAIPSILKNLDPASALRSLVEDFEEDETPLQDEIEARLIARVCKRAAVKAGQVLSPDEQRALIRDLEACVSPRTCPHGRPTMIHLSVDLLERQFGRKGAR